MRFIAALSIFIYHASDFTPWGYGRTFWDYLDITWQAGYAGLSFFFILSGFVLTWAWRSNDNARVFWRRRLVRIYPNHVLTFFVALAILAWVAPGQGTTNGWLANLFLIQAWFPQLAVRTSVNAVSWSMSAELLFYLCFPLLRRLIGRIKPEHLWTWAGVIIAAVIILPMLPAPHQTPIAHVGLTPYQLWILFHFPPARMLDFVLGIILSRIVMTGRKVPFSLGGSLAFLIAAYALSGFFPPKFQIVATIIAPAAFVIAAGAATDIKGIKTKLGSRQMVMLGDLAFAFYLWHRLVLTAGYGWFGQNKIWSLWGGLSMIAAEGAVAVGLAWLTFTYFEQPIMRRFSEPRKTRPQPTLRVAPDPDLVSVSAGGSPPYEPEPSLSGPGNGRADQASSP